MMKLFALARTTARTLRSYAKLIKWIMGGRKTAPPSLAKYTIIKTHFQQFNCSIFVETGTYFGDGVAAMRNLAEKIYSIELDEKLAAMARERFQSDPKVTILSGDSMLVLPKVIEQQSKPCLFWLDAHYSGVGTARAALDTPIVAELRYILSHWIKGSVILVDDSRLFVGQDGYPTIAEVEKMLNEQSTKFSCVVEADIIRIYEAGNR